MTAGISATFRPSRITGIGKPVIISQKISRETVTRRKRWPRFCRRYWNGLVYRAYMEYAARIISRRAGFWKNAVSFWNFAAKAAITGKHIRFAVIGLARLARYRRHGYLQNGRAVGLETNLVVFGGRVNLSALRRGMQINRLVT